MSNAATGAIMSATGVFLKGWQASFVNLEQVADRVDGALLPTASIRGGTASGAARLLALVGLPGSGKSLLARTLGELTSSVVISTDFTRGHLGHEPSYSDDELRFVYEVCYRVAQRRLSLGQRVIFDATNHTRAHRRRLERLAKEWGVPVAFCSIQAPEEVVSRRLGLRDISHRPEDVQSNARWEIYRLLAGLQEPMSRPHLELDSSMAAPEELAAAARKYWLDGDNAG
jgi:predicted kinase